MSENILKIKWDLRSILNSDIITAFLIGAAIAVMGLFTIIAIRSGGKFEIDMTAYGEYELEILILFVWFGALIIRAWNYDRR